MTTNWQQTLCAMIVAGAAGGFFATQTPIPLPQEPEAEEAETWPPYPADRIVNLSGIESFSKRSRDRTIFTVPDNFWLVVTDFRRTLPFMEANDPQIDLRMTSEGSKKDEVLIPHELSEAVAFGSGVGLKIPPLAKVILHRNAELSGDIRGLYMLTGYLVPEREEETDEEAPKKGKPKRR